MPNYKVTMLFNEFDQGWSESLFNSYTDLDAAIGRMAALSDRRIELLTPSAILKGIRVTEQNSDNARAPAPRLSRYYTANKVGQLGTASRPDMTGVAAYLLAQTSTGKKRRYEIRGLPDAQTIRSFTTGISEIGPALIGPLSAYTAFLIQQNFGLKATLPMTTIGNRPRLLKSMVANPDNANWTSFFVQAGDAIAEGDYVMFGNFDKRQLPGLAGIWPVIGPTTTSISIPYKWPGSASQNALRGYIRKVTFTYPAIIALDFQEFTVKQTGRPFSPQRGRRSAVSFRR